MSCIKIRYNGLSEWQKSALNTTDDQYWFEIPDNAVLRRSKGSTAVSLDWKLSAGYSYGLDIPSTDVNDILLYNYSALTTVDTLDTISIDVWQDGVITEFKRMVVDSFGNGSYEVSLQEANGNFFSKIKELKLSDIDYGSYVHPIGMFVYSDGTYSPTQTFAPIFMPVISYGGWVESAAKKRVQAEDRRPLISLYYIISQAICGVGYTLDSDILSSEYMRSGWVYILRKDFFITKQNKRDRYICSAFVNLNNYYLWPINNNYFYFSTNGMAQFDFGGQLTDFTKYAPPFYYQTVYRARFYGSGRKTGANTSYAEFITVRFVLVDTLSNTVISEEKKTVYLAAAENTNFDVSVEFVATNYYNRIDLIYEQFNTPGNDIAAYTINGKYEVVSTMNALISGDTYKISDLVRKDKYFSDLLKGVMHAFGLRLSVDESSKIVSIYTEPNVIVNGETIKGEILGIGEADIVCDSIEIDHKTDSGGEPDWYMFSDTKDAYVAGKGLKEPLYSRQVGDQVQNDESREVRSQNLFFEATAEYNDQQLYYESGLPAPNNTIILPLLPIMTDNIEGNVSYDIEPRILYGYGTVRIETESGGAYKQIWLADTLADLMPYAAQYTTQKIIDVNTALPKDRNNLVFGYESQDLYNRFLRSRNEYIQATAVLDIDSNFFSGINFRELYQSHHRGLPFGYVIRNISEFNPCDGIPPRADIAIPKYRVSCCEKPCNCKFKKCEYYQDFGNHTQSFDIEDLYIKYVYINGELYSDVEASLGVPNIIEIYGGSFYMNLVDAINSYGIPYFFASPSDKVTPNKGLRHFWIQRPACYTFEFEIWSYANNVPVLRYTDSVYEQNYYSTDPYTEYWIGVDWYVNTETTGQVTNCIEFSDYE